MKHSRDFSPSNNEGLKRSPSSRLPIFLGVILMVLILLILIFPYFRIAQMDFTIAQQQKIIERLEVTITKHRETLCNLEKNLPHVKPVNTLCKP